MRIHDTPHPLAGQTILLELKSMRYGALESGKRLVVEDWWDRVSGGSWQISEGNPATVQYMIRRGCLASPPIPMDDEVVYGHIYGLGFLVHITELGPVTEPVVRKVPGERGSLC